MLKVHTYRGDFHSLWIKKKKKNTLLKFFLPSTVFGTVVFTLKVSVLASLRQGSRLCISNRCPDDGDAVGPEAMLAAPLF